MNEILQSAVDAIVERFGTEVSEFSDETSLIVPPEKIVEVCRALRDEFGFNLLAAQTAVDYFPQVNPRFHVVIRVRALPGHTVLGLRVPLNGNAPTVPSLVEIYQNANWFERELWDMFGIRAEGHPDLRRILMPFDWEGHPLRKDYPLGYEEVQFTFNFEEIDVRKPYAKE